MAWYVDEERNPVDLNVVVVSYVATIDIYRVTDRGPTYGVWTQLFAMAGMTIKANELALAINEVEAPPVPPEREGEYVTFPDGEGLPSGGDTGDVLTKQSSDDGDADWEPPTSGTQNIDGGNPFTQNSEVVVIDGGTPL